MYKTILLAAALQRWERYSAHAVAARDVASALAQSSSHHLHILSIYDYEIPPSDLPPEMAAKWREDEVVRTDTLIARKMEEYLAPLKADGLKVSPILRVGNPRDIISEVAATLQADLLVIGTHSKRGFLDIALGGTAQRVTRHAHCTVVLVSPKK